MRTLPFVITLSFVGALAAQNDPPAPDAPKPEAEAPKKAGIDEALAKYHPCSGAQKVGKVAEVSLDEGWRWLDGADGRAFLVDCGNRKVGSDVLGVAVPPDYLRTGVFVVYSYAGEGHVTDDEKLDSEALLEQMRERVDEENEMRKQAKQPTVQLLGWAEPPHYDREHHKMYWAKRLQFSGQTGETLNYNVRVLGRTGHLVVNGVGDIDQLELVAAHEKSLLEATEFVDGQRYTDFKPDYDKIATYGIGGLVAGGIALKTGLFAKLGLLLVKLLKPLLVGVALFGAWIVKLFTGRKKSDEKPAKA